MISALRRVPGEYWIILVCAAGMFTTGYAVGARRAKPLPAVTTTVSTVKTDLRQNQIEDRLASIEANLKQFTSMDRTNDLTVNKKVTVLHKDGSSRTVEISSVDKSKTDVKQSTESTSASTEKTEAKTQTAEVQTADTKTVVTPVSDQRPKWSLGVAAGLHAPALLGAASSRSYVPGLPDWSTLSLSLDRQLIGPVYGGAWVDNHLDAGVELRLQWR